MEGLNSIGVLIDSTSLLQFAQLNPLLKVAPVRIVKQLVAVHPSYATVSCSEVLQRSLVVYSLTIP